MVQSKLFWAMQDDGFVSKTGRGMGQWLGLNGVGVGFGLFVAYFCGGIVYRWVEDYFRVAVQKS